MALPRTSTVTSAPAQVGTANAGFHRPPIALDHAGHGDRRGVRFPAAASGAGRSGGDHRRRQRDAGADRADPQAARPRRAVWRAVRALGLAGAARAISASRSSRNEPVDQADRPARRADLSLAPTTLCRRGCHRGHHSACSRPGRSARWIDRSSWASRCWASRCRCSSSATSSSTCSRSSCAGCRCRATRRSPRASGLAAQPRPALDRAGPRLCRADRPHHPRQPCWTCCPRTTSAPPRAKGVATRPDAAEARAEERRACRSSP